MAYSCAVRKETIRESYYLFKFIYYYVESSHLCINENILFHIDPFEMRRIVTAMNAQEIGSYDVSTLRNGNLSML